MNDHIVILEIRDKQYNVSYLNTSDKSSEKYISDTVGLGGFVIDILNTDRADMVKQLRENTKLHDDGTFSFSIDKYGYLLLIFISHYVRRENYYRSLISELTRVYDVVQCASIHGRLPWGDDISNFLELAEDSIRIKISLRDAKAVTQYCFDSILSLLAFDLAQINENNLVIKRCENCNKYFIPTNRSDEIYCDNIFKNGKTCKQLGYEIKLNKDEFKSAYRMAYKTQNARAARNKHIPNYKELHFVPWVDAAKKAMQEYQERNDSDGFKQWLDDNKDKF